MKTSKQARAIRTIAQIKYTARWMFAERGYHATRAQDIARESQVAHGTFYLHFKDKHDCFVVLLNEARLELNEYLRACQPHAATLEERISATLNALYDYSDHHSDVLRLALVDWDVISEKEERSLPMMDWAKQWADTVRREIEGRGGWFTYDFEVLGHAIVGAILQTTRDKVINRRDRKALVNTLTAFLMNGLGDTIAEEAANG